MRKVALLGTLVVLVIAVPAVMAKTSSAGSACSANKNDRRVSLRAHGLSCRAADKALFKAGNKGFACKPVGKTRKKPPFPFKCTSIKHQNVSYTYNVFGG
jgi:hypothetical protein